MIVSCLLARPVARGGAGLAQPPHSGTFRLYYLGRIARQDWLSPPTKKMLAPHHSGIFGLYYPHSPPVNKSFLRGFLRILAGWWSVKTFETFRPPHCPPTCKILATGLLLAV